MGPGLFPRPLDRWIVLDLNTPHDQEIARKLALKSDVIVENFKLGTMERWGLSYEELSAENPSLVYCSISGYGRTGPYADKGGFEGRNRSSVRMTAGVAPASMPPLVALFAPCAIE